MLKKTILSAPKPSTQFVNSFCTENDFEGGGYQQKYDGPRRKALYIGNLAFTVGETELRNLFSEYGTVHKVKMVTDPDTGRPRGFAFIVMEETAIPNVIQSLNGFAFQGRSLKVSNVIKKPQDGEGGYQRRDRGDGGEGGYQRRERSEGDGGYQRRDRGDGEGGYQRRDRGDGEGGYQRRERRDNDFKKE